MAKTYRIRPSYKASSRMSSKEGCRRDADRDRSDDTVKPLSARGIRRIEDAERKFRPVKENIEWDGLKVWGGILLCMVVLFYRKLMLSSHVERRCGATGKALMRKLVRAALPDDLAAEEDRCLDYVWKMHHAVENPVDLLMNMEFPGWRHFSAD